MGNCTGRSKRRCLPGGIFESPISGREIGYAVYNLGDGGDGRSKGEITCVYLHGTPGSRLEPRGFLRVPPTEQEEKSSGAGNGKDANDVNEATREARQALYAKALGGWTVKIIAVDRAGYGLSSPLKPAEDLSSFSKDVVALVDHVTGKGAIKFAVLGVSGGGPLAAACAASISTDRIIGVILVSAVLTFGERKVEGFASAQEEGLKFGAPALKFSVPPKCILSCVAPCFMPGRKDGEKMERMSEEEFFKSAAKFAPSKCDQIALSENRYVLADLFESIDEGMRDGVEGLHYDYSSLRASENFEADWGVQLSDCECPVIICHGKDDRNVPPSHASSYHQLFPTSSLHIVDGEGHYSLLFRHIENILRFLMSFADPNYDSDLIMFDSTKEI